MSSFLVEQYASQVLDFSSQYGTDLSISYTAESCLGLPSKFPAYGDFPQSFALKEFGPWWNQCPSRKLRCSTDQSNDFIESDFIDLKFEHPVFAHAVYIYETFNPGAVVSIWAGDCKGKWQQIWHGPPAKVGHQPRAFCPPIKSTDFPINQLRIHFDQRHLSYYTEIDAVALLGTSSPTTFESRLIASLPPSEQRGVILEKVVKMKLFKNPNLVAADDLIGLISSFSESNRPDVFVITGNGFFELLPREVVFRIFQYLDLFSLVQCHKVCKLFYQVASDPMLYVNINLKPLFYCASNDTLKFLFKRSVHLLSLDLSWCGSYGKISPKVLERFLHSRGNRLSRLILANCHVASRAVIDLLPRFSQLCELNLSNCCLLEPMNFFCLREVKNLQSLNLYRTRVIDEIVKKVLENNPRLQYLNVSSCSNIHGDEICKAVSNYGLNITALDMWRTPTLTDRGIFFLALGAPNLQELDVGWCLGVQASTGCIKALTEGCPNIVKLFLTAHRQTSDNDITNIADHLSNLEQLSIMGTRSVNPSSVTYLASRIPTLKFLDLGYCEFLENQPFLNELHALLPGCHILTSFNQS